MKPVVRSPRTSRCFAALVRLLLTMSWVTSAGCGGTVPLGGGADIIQSERVWIDSSRSTPRTSGFPGAPTRTLRTLIWQPTPANPLPLLVMAHGFGALPEDFNAFAHTVAAAGFVLVAPAFPLTNQNVPGGQLGLTDLNHQPGDLSFVITQVLQAAASAGDPLHGRIAPTDVAVLGQSLGGATVIGLTRKSCCRDSRVRASILSASPLLPGSFGPDPISAAGPPTLILHGTADTTVTYATATQLFDLIDAPRFLLGLQGAEHSDALESQAEPPIPARDAAQRATVAFLNAVFRGASAELNATLAGLAAQGNLVQADWGGAR
jgi:predicted dienelactone hydrolase